MKSRNRRPIELAFAVVGSSGPRQKFGNALLHFACGFVRERDRQYIFRRDTRLDHVRDTISDHTRFAGASAGEDQDRAANGLHRQTLLWIKRTQLQHRARSLKAEEVKARTRA